MKKHFQQILVSEIRNKGQKAFLEAKVLIVGAGGLGTPLATYLATTGIGKIGIVDGDKVEITNLHRQFQYNEQDLGKLKAEVLAEKLKLLSPTTDFQVYPYFLDAQNITQIEDSYTVICDCTDNLKARLLLNKYVKQHQKPLIYGAARDWQGYISILHGENKIDLFDIFSETELQAEGENACSVAGIVSPYWAKK
ncbi:MAG: HesA/MoeB/ThiF family protein [Bacteroidetes bacterium]|nr:MAG: HesA/MoeB/ThiF family protein [Bacteroidota bacterium]